MAAKQTVTIGGIQFGRYKKSIVGPGGYIYFEQPVTDEAWSSFKYMMKLMYHRSVLTGEAKVQRKIKEALGL
jgi:hypothetical protein